MTESVAVPSLANLDQVPGARAVARLWLAAWGRKSRWPNAIGGGELMIISASLINSYQFTVSPLWRPVGATMNRPHPLQPTLYPPSRRYVSDTSHTAPLYKADSIGSRGVLKDGETGSEPASTVAE